MAWTVAPPRQRPATSTSTPTGRHLLLPRKPSGHRRQLLHLRLDRHPAPRHRLRRPGLVRGRVGQLARIRRLSPRLTPSVARETTAPVPDAGADQAITLPPDSTTLNGSAEDDGLPSPPGASTYTWTEVSGPHVVSFATPNAPSTDVTFPEAGVYVLRLTVSDSDLSAFDDVAVTVAGAVAPAVLINAGGPNFTDSLGRLWIADANFSGGNTSSTSSAIAGTVEDTLYQTERYGNFSYQIPLTPGTYQVTLHFAEIFHNSPGLRLFDVSLEGALVLDNFDVFQAAGAKFTAISRTFSVPVTDGTLNINFVTVLENATRSRLSRLPLTRVIPTSMW